MNQSSNVYWIFNGEKFVEEMLQRTYLCIRTRLNVLNPRNTFVQDIRGNSQDSHSTNMIEPTLVNLRPDPISIAGKKYPAYDNRFGPMTPGSSKINSAGAFPFPVVYLSTAFDLPKEKEGTYYIVTEHQFLAFTYSRNDLMLPIMRAYQGREEYDGCAIKA